MNRGEENNCTTVESGSKDSMVSLGARLQAVRIDRGETLDAVSKVTRIGKNYLEALEAGAVEKLPSEAYTRGFIKLYAAHLGLDPQGLLAPLDGSTPQPAETVPSPFSPRYATEHPLTHYRFRVLVAVIATTVLVAAYILFKPAGKPPTDSQPPTVVTAPPSGGDRPTVDSKEPSLPGSDSSPSPATTGATDEPARNDGTVLRLRAISDGKIHVAIDDGVAQEYDLRAGDIVEWKAETRFVLDLENAASVAGELDGAKIKPFGEPGKSAHIELKADGSHPD